MPSAQPKDALRDRVNGTRKGESGMKKIALLALALTVATIAGCQSKGAQEASETQSQSGAFGGGNLVSRLEMVRAQVQLVYTGALIKQFDMKTYNQMFSSPEATDYDHRVAALRNAHRDGRSACDAWKANKPANVVAAAVVYCTLWDGTLDGYVDSTQEKFLGTPAGVQYLQAKAEFLAIAGD
jgi:hypothetical protein